MSRVFRGVVVSADDVAKTVTFAIPYVASDQQYGPLPTSVLGLVAGDEIIVTELSEGVSDDFVVISKVGGAPGGGGGGAVSSVFGRTGAIVAQTGDYTATQVGAVAPTRQIIAGTGLAGGGDLSADRTLTVSYGTAAGTAAQGNDSRITGAIQNTRQVIAGTGLTGGGALTADVTLTVAYGTTSTTACVGNDSRLSDTRTPTDNSVTSAKIVDGTIVNVDISSSAAIALSKLATDPLARANHTGTQTASTISDFDTQVHTSRLDQMAAPTADLSINSHKLTNVTDPASAQDAATKNYVDSSSFGTWTDFPSLGTNLAHGTPHAQYRTAPGNMLQLRGQLQATGAFTTATMTTLPFSFAAAREFNVRVKGLGANVFVDITTGGAMTQSGTLANTHTMNFDGITLSL